MIVTDSGHGPALVLLHGFTGSAASWEPLTQTLAQKHRVLAVDLPGHASNAEITDPQHYRMPQVARALADELRAHDIAHTRVLGYSMGGRLALYFALEYPQLVSWLILESSSPGLKTEQERAERRARDAALAARIEQHGIEAFVSEWEALPLFASQRALPAHIRQRIHAQRLACSPSGLAHSLREMGTGAQPSLWHRLGEIQFPTLLISGELDHKFTAIARHMRELIPQCEHRIIPNCGHTLHLESPTIFASALRD